MNNRITLPPKIRKEVYTRDDYTCMKCRNHRKLEIHHIVPVVYGGLDQPYNLITLCRACHKWAPDDPVKFFKWCSTSLPPKMDSSKILTKSVFAIVKNNPDWMKLLTGSWEDLDKLMTAIDEVYKDIWEVRMKNDMSELGKFFEKHWKQEEKCH